MSYLFTNWMETTRSTVWKSSVLLIHKLDGDNPEAQCGSLVSYFLTNWIETTLKHSVEAKCLTYSQTGWRQPRNTVWKPSVLLPHKEDGDNPEAQCGSQVSYFLTIWMETTQKHNVEANCLISSQRGWRPPITSTLAHIVLLLFSLRGAIRYHCVLLSDID